MPDFFLKRGDTLSQIQVQLLDGLGVPVNLYGTTVKFQMRSFLTGEMILSAPAEIVGEPSEGVVQYTWLESDTSTAAGEYFAEWQVTKAGNNNQTFPTRGYHLISVQDDLDSLNLNAGQFMTVRRLRGMVAEPSQDAYTDSALAAMLDRNEGDLFATAAEIWRQKAATYSELVDVSESGNSQKLSQLYQNAKTEAMTYETASANGGMTPAAPVASGYPVTRPIERV